MLIGTLLMLSSRRVAVTTISSSAPAGAGGAGGGRGHGLGRIRPVGHRDAVASMLAHIKSAEKQQGWGA